LQLPAFRLTLDSIRPARPAAVITLAACALSAQTWTRPNTSAPSYPRALGVFLGNALLQLVVLDLVECL
jgi:hypothetical protein